MATPLVQGDKITGMCNGHQIPNPSSGAPQPAPPMPFSAPLTMQLSTKVTIGGSPVAVVGSWGLNESVHPGLHASDPYVAPPQQKATVMNGYPKVTVGGQAIATTDSTVKMCMAPGTAVPTQIKVKIG